MDNYIINHTDSGCEFRIHVSANSKVFQISGLTFDKLIKIKCSEPAVEGRANREIAKRLTEFFGVKTEIKKGSEKSTRKWVVVSLPLEDVKEKLDKELGLN